jgi:hypothetical protein
VIAVGQFAKKSRAHPDEIGRQHGNANLGPVGTTQRDGGIRFHETGHGADGSQAVQIDGRRGATTKQGAEYGRQ